MADVGDDRRELPDEIVRLVHHVELHRSGWWDRAVERLLEVTVWLLAPVERESLVEQFTAALDQAIERERVHLLIARSLAAGNLVELPDGRLKVVEEVGDAFAAEREAIHGVEASLRERLQTIAAAHGMVVESDELWSDFTAKFIGPLVTESGARLYEVLSSSIALDAALPTYGTLVRPLCEKYGEGMRLVLIELLDPDVPAVRTYVLQRLNASFVREAAALDKQVLHALSTGRGRPDRVRVLIDTNFVFSFLGLHDNPSNDVARDLIRLASRLQNTIKVDFYVLPITVDEIRHVLRDVMIRLADTRPMRNVATAARQLPSPGLVARYLDAASKATARMTPDDFFGPYERNLVSVLRQRGVELFNADLDALRVDQAVIDDLHDQEEIQARRRRGGAKGYEANLHDMVLWHFAARQRPSSLDSPLDVNLWVCTIDYGFMAFDRVKRRRRPGPPVCLSPSSLVQLLQFWAPRSDELDTALVGALREPLLFLDFDRGAEQATIQIINSLSRFEGVDDLSTKTIYNVLTNDALRSRLAERGSESPDVAFELVEAAVVEEARRLEAELAALEDQKAVDQQRTATLLEERQRDAERLETLLAAREEEISRLSAELSNTRSAMDAEQAAKAAQLSNVSDAHRELAERLAALEAKGHRRAAGWRVVVQGAAALLLLGVLSVLGARQLTGHLPAEWLAWAASVTTAVLLWLLAIERSLARFPPLRGDALRSYLAKARNWLVSGAAAIAASVTASAVWEALRG